MAHHPSSTQQPQPELAVALLSCLATILVAIITILLITISACGSPDPGPNSRILTIQPSYDLTGTPIPTDDASTGRIDTP